MSYPIAPGGLAAVLAHPDDESFGCGGALALAHDAGATTRLLVVTRGEAGSPDGSSDPAVGDQQGPSQAELPGQGAEPPEHRFTEHEPRLRAPVERDHSK